MSTTTYNLYKGEINAKLSEVKAICEGEKE